MAPEKTAFGEDFTRSRTDRHTASSAANVLTNCDVMAHTALSPERESESETVAMCS